MHDESIRGRTDICASLPRPPVWAPSRSGNGDRTDARAASVSPSRYRDLSQQALPLVTEPQKHHTSRERLSWQTRTTRVLADRLRMASRDGLPSIAWTVGNAGATLTGRCYGRTTTDRRREFDERSAAVGAAPRPEFTDFGGVTRLRAVVKDYDGLVDVVVLADLYPTDDESDGADR